MVLENSELHIFFLPFMAPGHMIPTMHMGRLFATRGVKSTIITTPANMSLFAETSEIAVLTIKFPSEEVGLPEGCENADLLSSPETFLKFYKAIDLLQKPFEDLLEEVQPDCIVADSFFSWASSSAKKLGLPCLAFHGCSYFSQCIISNLTRYEPHKKLTSHSESFSVPGDLPHEIRLTKSQLSMFDRKEGPKFMIDQRMRIREEMKECYGVIMNSFYELEPDYADYYEKVLAMRHWHIGPLSPHFHDENKANQTVKKSSVDARKCMIWLDEKEPDSVIYVSFGSVSDVTEAQINEIAIALETFGQNFILVVRKDTKNSILDETEERVRGRGMIIRGWAPQSLILNHKATGGFVTHCGWNSVLEGVIAGLPMLTWPLHAEQFYNEKLVTNVLKIGVQVGAKRWTRLQEEDEKILIGREMILNAMEKLMIGEEAKYMRFRATELKEMAGTAISVGGSSYSDLNALIEELKLHKNELKVNC